MLEKTQDIKELELNPSLVNYMSNFLRGKRNSLVVKLLLTSVFLLTTILVSGQNSAVGLVFAPTDKAVGLRFDAEKNNIGFYSSACWGNYTLNYGTRINDHVKLSAGVVKYLPNRMRKFTNMFSLGLSYHTYGKTVGEYMQVPANAFRKVSVDVGVGFKVNRFNIGWCYDPFKKEVVVNSGFFFN